MSHSALDNRFMEFVVAGQYLAIPLILVKEVIQKPEITSVPNMPEFFVGMMNLRGKIIGVFHSQKKLGLPKQESVSEKNQVVIIVEESGVNVGMIVDEVTKVIQVTNEMIKDAPLKVDDVNRKYIANVIQTKDHMVLALNIGQLLDIERYKQSIAA